MVFQTVSYCDAAKVISVYLAARCTCHARRRQKLSLENAVLDESKVVWL